MNYINNNNNSNTNSNSNTSNTIPNHSNCILLYTPVIILPFYWRVPVNLHNRDKSQGCTMYSLQRTRPPCNVLCGCIAHRSLISEKTLINVIEHKLLSS